MRFPDREPVDRPLPRDIRRADVSSLQRLATGGSRDQFAQDANDWYWAERFGHPLHDNYHIGGLLYGASYYAKPLSQDEIAVLTRSDFEVLSYSPSDAARHIVASHAATSAHILERLAFDPHPAIRKAVGHNPTTPAAVIARMQANYRGDGISPDVNPYRFQMLWTEIDDAAIDEELAMVIASGYSHADDHRLILARRDGLSRNVRIALAQSYKMTPELARVLADDTSVEVRAELASNSGTPEDVLDLLAADRQSSVRIQVGRHVRTSREAQQALLRDDDPAVRAAVGLYGHLSCDDLVALDGDPITGYFLHARLRRDQDGEESAHDRVDTETPHVSLLRTLARSDHADTRALVALSPWTPIDVLEILAEDQQEVVSRAVVKALGENSTRELAPQYHDHMCIWWHRRELNSDELARLSRSHVPSLRLVPVSRADSAESVHAFVADSDPSIRRAAASNRRISFDDFVALAHDDNLEVQKAIEIALSNWLHDRANPRKDRRIWLADVDPLPDGVPRWNGRLYADRLRTDSSGLGWQWRPLGCDLDRLVTSPSATVRATVAGYSSIWPQAHGEWTTGKDFELSETGLMHLLKDPDKNVRKSARFNTGPAALALAARVDLPSDLLLEYARSKSAEMRAVVAANPASSGPLLGNMARDAAKRVRAAVAGNPRTPPEALAELARNAKGRVLQALTTNPQSPSSFLSDQADRAMNSGDTPALRKLLANPSTIADVLRRLAYNQSGDIRRLVAAHPNTPADTLEVLVLDEDPIVRTVAEGRN